MRYSKYLVVSCGSSHIVAASLRMNAAGRCDLLDYRMFDVDFETNDALLWLKAASQQFSDVRRNFPSDEAAGFTLPGHLALTKYLKIPQAPIKKRHRIVSYEARQNIPYPMSDVTWDECLIDEDDLDFEIVIAAAKTELLEALTRYGKESKLGTDLIEPSFISLLNGFRYNYPDVSDCSMIVSIGARSTDLIVYEQEKYYSRNLSFGGNTITQSMGDALGIPFADAEIIKQSAIQGEALPSIEYSAFSDATESFLKRLSVEISRTMAIFKTQGYHHLPQRGFMTGGGSLLPGIENRLSEQLKVSFEAYDPLKRVRSDDISDQSQLGKDKRFLGDAIGMAIGRFLPDSSEINLLPRSILWQRKFKKQQRFYLAAGFMACVTVFLPLVNSFNAIDAYEQEVLNLSAQIAPLSELNRRIHEKTEAIRNLKSVIENASELADSRSNWMRFFNDLQQRLTSVEDVWLDRLDVVRPEVATTANNSGNRFSRRAASQQDESEKFIRLRLEGRLIDVKNPLSSVSQDSNLRVKALLESFENSSFVQNLENESFDNSLPGILKFNFTLVVDPARPL